jgi:hypothetical protein
VSDRDAFATASGSRSLLALMVLGAGIAFGPGWSAATEPWATTAPSAAEQERLQRGDVVYRSGAAPRDGVGVPGARGAVAFVRVPTGPGAVWAILTAPRRYPEIFPGLRAVELLEESASSWLVRTEGRVGPFDFRYHTRYQLHPETHLITWRLDTTRDNDVFDDNWGWWRLLREDGGTVVVYAIGSIPSSWQPLAGFFERWGITRALGALRDAALRR